jgi:hypothetical protein
METVSVSPKTDYVSLISSTHPHYIMEEDEIKDVISKYSSKITYILDKLDKLDEIDVH